MSERLGKQRSRRVDAEGVAGVFVDILLLRLGIYRLCSVHLAGYDWMTDAQSTTDWQCDAVYVGCLVGSQEDDCVGDL